MLRKISYKAEKFFSHFAWIAGSAIFAFFLVLISYWLILERSQAINTIKQEILKVESSLLAAGYDIAYEHLSFSLFSPWQILRIQNFKIYSLDTNNYKEWQFDEVAVSSDIFNTKNIRFHFSKKQTLQVGSRKWDVEIPQCLAEMTIAKQNFIQDFHLQAADIKINNLADISEFRFALQRANGHLVNENSPFMETLLEIKDAHIDDYTAWPMNKHIDHIFLNANIIGEIEEQPIFSESLYSWIENNGFIDIQKLIINWKPLVMVAKGDLFFNEQLEPDITLNTSSMALADTLEEMNQNSWLDDKGVFVVKILLNNKSFKKNQSDRYFTVTTPIKVNNQQVLVENIPVWQKEPTKAPAKTK